MMFWKMISSKTIAITVTAMEALYGKCNIQKKYFKNARNERDNVNGLLPYSLSIT